MDISDIYTQLQKEKERKNLEKIQKGFYQKISELIKKYRKQLDLYKTQNKEYKELESTINKIQDSISDLINIRIKKIINMTLLEVKEDLSAIDQENLQEEEKMFYSILKNLILSYKINVENQILNGEEIKTEDFYKYINIYSVNLENKIEKDILIINKDLPKIVGTNGRIYGPFKVGDIIILDKEMAKKLENTKIGTLIN
ncbi:DNA replication factor GINS [Nanobdella aerobiophila]|uniref:DNA replication factor GINS n=1 Tax=Nanobdella aerobiophila TaxID=2586965 RepID=A0A915WRH0_9ARCH|nr:hypothetical protein [Nanobdella aerobiophila]BBL45618.1 DNA replication factor GINS [Nanobdella aerobiophila]